MIRWAWIVCVSEFVLQDRLTKLSKNGNTAATGFLVCTREAYVNQVSSRSCVGQLSHPRMEGKMRSQMEKMQSIYDQLTTFLSEATVRPETLDRRG